MPTVPNYAIEARIQVVSVPHGSGSFLITADRAAGKDGYQAGVLNIRSGPRPDFSHPQAQIYIDPLSSMEPGGFHPIDFEPGSQWRTYRIEVQDARATFFMNGSQISTAYSTQTNTLSSGPIRLSSTMLILRVSNFLITAL